MWSTLITNALCVEFAEERWRCRRRHIALAGSSIGALLDPDGPLPMAQEFVDATGMLAVPGFINAHYHSPDNLIRGSAPDLPLELWSLTSASGREGRSPREVYVSAVLGAVEMLRTGTTTVLDHIRISPDLDRECLDAAAQAYADIGMRSVIAPAVADKALAETLPFVPSDFDPLADREYGNRTGLPAPEQLAVVDSFIKDWHGRHGRIQVAIGPSGPQRCTDDLLTGAADLARRHNVSFHTHVLETKAQQAMARRLYGKPMIAHMADLGLLGRRTHLVHAIWLEAEDAERISQSGAVVVHNPVSNARLGSGVCGLPELLDAGVRIALGTDSACCNDSNNMLETVKWTSLIHNGPHRKLEEWVGPGKALELATHRGADALGLDVRAGNLAPGHAADFTLFRLASPSFAPLTDAVRQLVNGENGSAVDTVFVNGRTVARGGRCRFVDEEAVWSEAQSLFDRRMRDNRDRFSSALAMEHPIKKMYRRLSANEAEGC